MCSLGDDNFENDANKIIIQKDIKISSSSLCNKCRKEKGCIILRCKDVYCKSCFLAGSIHKFKGLLGKSKLIRINDRVLIYHKVGHPSTALLHLLRTGLELNTHKKLRFIPIILFLEDQFQMSVKERQETLRKVKEEVESFGFDFYCVSFTDYLLNPDKIQNASYSDLRISENDEKNVKSMLDSKISQTNRNELIGLFKRQLLILYAKHFNCKFIFTPEISVDIASNLLTNVSLGRGCYIPIDTGFCDDRDKEVKLLRPLRLFDMKELTFYNNYNNLEPVAISQIEENPYSSVQGLITKFVNELQQNFPATISTVMKTGDKLSLCDEKSGSICTLCKGILPKKNLELTSEESTKFSHNISTKTPDYKLSGQERYQDVLEEYKNQVIDENNYCYSCSNIKSYILNT